ncbi:MAG: hypothetical protein U1E53_27800 [Dongiaceae bacterium]
MGDAPFRRRLMERDEAGTLVSLKARQDAILQPLLARQPWT